MSGLNRVYLLGHLASDPELKHFEHSTKLTFRLAITERYQARDGEAKENTTFITCDWFTKSAEKMMEWLRKGRLVLVEGAIQVRGYEKDGQKQTFTSIRVTNLQLGDGKAEGGDRERQTPSPRPYAASGSSSPGGSISETYEDEIPF